MKFASLSEPFIRRPVATTLLTFAIALAGMVSFGLLPVSPLPQVDFPAINVSASLPGASPETMSTSVTTPLERQLGRIAGVTEMTSNSSLGRTSITLIFDLSRDIDGAARDVQAALNAALAQLPSVPTNPTYRKINPAESPVMILAMTSKTLGLGEIYDAASNVVAQKISQIEGVGQASIGGATAPAIRIDINPTALNKYGIALDTVRIALQNANANRPKGYIERDGQHWQIYTNDQLGLDPVPYRNLIVTWKNGAPVRLSDVADVDLGVQDIRNQGLFNGERAVIISINKQPNANIIKTLDRIRALLPKLRASIPSDIDLDVAIDRTNTIRASLHDVEATLAVSVLLVVLVVFVFLRNWRATLIPAVAVPVSLIGTFSAMYLFGFSLDILSLMALTIATGFVVDDAVVVLENISRHMEAGMSRLPAVLLGAREVGFTVLSMSLSLIAVFIPILLMGGLVGRYFREFSITLSVAILVSLVVSLTTTPMMCARFLRHAPVRRESGRFFAFSERAFAALAGGYERTLARALKRPLLMMFILAMTVCLNVYLYAIVPKGFFPTEDTGFLVGFAQADQSISFQLMSEKMREFTRIVKNDPAVQAVVSFTGGFQRNGGFAYAALKPMSERKLGVDEVIARLRPSLSSVAGAQLFLQPAQDIRTGGRQGSSTYQYTLQSDDLHTLREWSDKIYQALLKAPELTDVNSDQSVKGLQTTLNFDRPTAARLGITTQAIDATLNDAFSQRNASTIYTEMTQYFAVMQLQPQFLQSPDSLNDIWVRSNSGKMVPLTAFANWGLGTTPLGINHQSQFVSTTISFNLADGVSLGEASAAIERTMMRLGVPVSIHGGFAGNARAFVQGQGDQLYLILAALIAIYIVLGVLYESYVHPLTILSTLPSAGVGAILALLVCKTQFTLIAFIGVILLIGIVKKNAIMMIDFALVAEREQGLSSRDAVFQACKLRFRPIMMTTMAAMLGALPLAIGFGEGSEMRKPLGISIVGGLLVSQLLTLYTTPVVYLYMDRFRLRCKRAWARLHPPQPDSTSIATA
ncbi:MAG: multidrug efflux RND transporter permease subunit [Proteobacteria bacterium]|nr:multidrug efflux RND transporter permease subunit [Pseudomonadota bacterium]